MAGRISLTDIYSSAGLSPENRAAARAGGRKEALDIETAPAQKAAAFGLKFMLPEEVTDPIPVDPNQKLMQEATKAMDVIYESGGREEFKQYIRENNIDPNDFESMVPAIQKTIQMLKNKGAYIPPGGSDPVASSAIDRRPGGITKEDMSSLVQGDQDPVEKRKIAADDFYSRLIPVSEQGQLNRRARMGIEATTLRDLNKFAVQRDLQRDRQGFEGQQSAKKAQDSWREALLKGGLALEAAKLKGSGKGAKLNQRQVEKITEKETERIDEQVAALGQAETDLDKKKAQDAIVASQNRVALSGATQAQVDSFNAGIPEDIRKQVEHRFKKARPIYTATQLGVQQGKPSPKAATGSWSDLDIIINKYNKEGGDPVETYRKILTSPEPDAQKKGDKFYKDNLEKLRKRGVKVPRNVKPIIPSSSIIYDGAKANIADVGNDQAKREALIRVPRSLKSGPEGDEERLLADLTDKYLDLLQSKETMDIIPANYFQNEMKKLKLSKVPDWVIEDLQENVGVDIENYVAARKQQMDAAASTAAISEFWSKRQEAEDRRKVIEEIKRNRGITPIPSPLGGN